MFSKGWRSARGGFLVKAAAAAVLAAALAGCGDTADSPLAAPAGALAKKNKPAAPTTPAATPGSSLTPNSIKYRNNGAPHATGRSGSATLEGRAVIDAHGVIHLVITTGQLDSPTPAPGEIVKAQIKVFSAAGQLLSVDNHNHLTGGGVQTFLLNGFDADVRIQVQANVRGIDGNRTDVVTLSAGVAHAAQLRVDLQLPGQASVGMPTVINGVVSEVGGDVGTRADCVLYVDGHEVDRADDIWVDAGDAVTCAFTYVFSSAGHHTVEVRVNGEAAAGGLGVIGAGDGGDLDVGGDPATIGQSYTASAEMKLSNTTSISEYTWWKPDGSHKEYSQTSTATHRTQAMRVDATLTRALQFPLAGATLTMSSGGSTWENEAWTGLTAGVTPQGEVCANRQVPEQGALFWVCNAGGGAVMGYTRFAGTVVYHSEGFVSLFDGPTATTSGYTWNDTWEEYDGGGAVFALGATVSFAVTLTDGQGTIGFSPVVSLSPFSSGPTVTPRTCVTESLYWLDGGDQTTCSSGTASESGVRGSTSG